MLRNYFKIALRQLRKQKLYSAIKIGGFSLGIAACLLIALYIKDGLSYDQYADGERIYRLVGVWDEDEGILKGAHHEPPMATTLKQDFPEVELAGRIMPNNLFWGAGSNYLRVSDRSQNNYEEHFAYADQEILDIFQIPMVYGKRAVALKEPFSIVISKKISEKYFPGKDPLGKVVYLNEDKQRAYTIRGVIDDFPQNSHLKYDFLLTLSGIEFWRGEQTGWQSSNYFTYVKLRPSVDIQSLNKEITRHIVNTYQVPSMISSGVKDALKFGKQTSFVLQPVKDIYLKSYDIHDRLEHGDIRFIWLFGAIACFILVIACINFINLSTAKSASRAKEVGLRKVVGSQRNSLIKQFLTESFLYCFLSLVLGVLLAWGLLPFFNTLASKTLTMPWSDWRLIPMLLFAAVVIGVVAGLYPAVYLSSFNPAAVLKGSVSRGVKNSLLRNGLVVFQFTISVVLIVGTLVIYSQMRYILDKDLGFSKDQIIMIQGTNTLESKVSSFKAELLKLSAVKSVSVSDFLPVSGTKRNGNRFYNEGKTTEETGAAAQIWDVDHDYIQTLGLRLVTGRNFSKDMPTDSQSVVINQKMAAELGLKQPIGRKITNGDGHYTVIGVVKDFNFETMKQDVGSLALRLSNSPGITSVKVSGEDMKKTLSSITAVWKIFAPDQPIRYSFLDDSFAKMYEDVQRMGLVFTSFAILAIIIACLGLFALSAFMAEQRNKEIGVRKVLGASVQGITTMLSKDFIKLVLISIIIASPIAWWAMNKWLEDYTYKTNVSWWMFVSAGLLVIIIALATISFQAIKAALMNPVKSLRSE